MANYVRQTWVDGDPSKPTSAARLTVIENGIFDAHFQPAARAYHSAAQSITSAVVTALALNSERFDTDTIHDLVTNNSRLTCRTAGKYLVGGSAEWSASPTAAQIHVRLNGATVIGRQDIVADFRVMTVSTMYDMAVNDYVELMVFQSSGGALNVNSTGNYSPEFWMTRVA